MPLNTLCFLLVTPHKDGLYYSIEVLFSIILNVFLKHFHLFYEGFVIITLTFWTLVNTFQMFYFHFKSKFFFQKLSKFTNPLSCYVIFKFDLHHIQMDVAQFSCCHGVLIQFLSLIYTIYKCMQPNFLTAMGCWYKF